MKRFSLCFIALVSFAGLSRAQTPQSAAAPSAPRALANNDATYVKLRNSRVGLDAVAVQDFTLKRDAGTFLFKSGAFYLLEPVNGKITGAVFLGDATFTLIPPIEVERRYLSILTRGQPFEEQFSGAVFRFTDGTDEELRKASTKGSAPASGDANGLLNDIRTSAINSARSSKTISTRACWKTSSAPAAEESLKLSSKARNTATR